MKHLQMSFFYFYFYKKLMYMKLNIFMINFLNYLFIILGVGDLESLNYLFINHILVFFFFY